MTMATCAQLLVFLLLRLCPKAQAALIQTTHTEVVVALGGKASLDCQLTQSKQVLQVTWQKILPEGSINLATYNRRYGPKVIGGFRGKVEFKAAGFQNNSIIILGVTEQDEGCYCCLFSFYPHGDVIGRTCLRLYELQPPVLQLQQSPSGSQNVSCSATGYPAPDLTLDVSPQRNVSITHGNGSVTVTAWATLSSGSRTSVRCTARVLSYPEMEDVIYFPKVNGPSALVADDGFDSLPMLSIGSVLAIMILICVVIGIICKWRRNRVIEKVQNPALNTESLLQSSEITIPPTPMRSIKGIDVMATPLYTSAEKIRQRTSPESTRKRPRKLDFDQHRSPNEKE